MVNPLTWLSKRRFPYQPLIAVEISKSRILHNLDQFRTMAPRCIVAPVLKSNAYGHGLREVGAILKDQKDIPFFIVDSYFEAVALHSAGIRSPILIIGYSRPETIMHSRLKQAVFAISSIETLNGIARSNRRIPIHIKIDTGMNRQGILPEDIDLAIETIESNPNLDVQGIMSHLSSADNPVTDWTNLQIKAWNKAAKKFRAHFPHIRYFHLGATAGHRFSDKIEANVTRLGIGLYGLAERKLFPGLDMQPVLEMKTVISGVKKVKRGQTVGYDNAFRAPDDMRIATIPAGYFEGVDRRLSDIGFVSVICGGGTYQCPIVGRVSMNITTIDVTRVPDADIGTEVAVISNDPEAENSIIKMARIAGTIPYEIAVRIPSQLKKVIVA